LNNWKKGALKQAKLISLGLSVADGKTDYDKILSWIKEHEI